MVQHKKTSHNSANGTSSKESLGMSYQKRDTPDNRSTGGNSGKGNKANGTSNFRTDTAISSSRANRERVLQPWVAPSGSEGIDMTLGTSTGGRAWDQFAVNERQFGIKTTYDENIYTTAIDKNHPQYKERLAKADKAAKEIENSATTTAHHAEERQMNFVGGDDAGDDEEEKYSGVKRQDFPALGNRETKYTPPARRAPAAASTVKGAPVDPAIISSQLRTQKPQPQLTSKQEDAKIPASSSVEAAPAPIESKPDPKADGLQKSADAKPTTAASTPLKPSAATTRTISPRSRDAQTMVPNATATVERDVLKDFKTFAQQQRINVDKARHTKAKADKEVKLIELKRFADNFKLPTPVPLDLISIIAKDPAKQREIQEKANRDAQEVAKRKADEANAKEKEKREPAKPLVEAQPNVVPAVQVENRPSRAANASTTGPSAQMRHQGGRVPPNYSSFPNNRSIQHMPPQGRQGGLTHRLRESQKTQPPEMRMPPTGPANAVNPSYPHRMGMPNHLGPKLNPTSHEFRPNAFAPSFSPNGHPSAGSSPRSAINHANGPSGANAHAIPPIVITKKGRKPDPKKCNILTFAKTIQPPETKNWSENGDLRPSYDTPPTWRSLADDEKPDSTMRLTCDEFFERQPFNAQPTPNPPHLLPQHMPHQHQLPLHMQHATHNVGPRHSPHAPPVQMHGGQHNPVPHGPFNGGDDHRMMHSNSNQSFSSPRMGHQVPMTYSATMHSTPQIPYSQHMMPPFMGPQAPQMNNFNRSLSNNGQFIPQQSGAMGAPMMMQPSFMAPGMVAGPPQMHMYTGGQPFIPPGTTPQPLPGAANGYPSPGRPSAPMMVPGGSSQGQVMYAQSPSMQYQQPYAAQPAQSMSTKKPTSYQLRKNRKLTRNK
ncbi:hypothetical protein F4777DRAFT_342855 [Nemania sp. FL0916]|nr:hypothetical protein F4777DRAFT_342855 [Nemania sp. FL0916]